MQPSQVQIQEHGRVSIEDRIIKATETLITALEVQGVFHAENALEEFNDSEKSYYEHIIALLKGGIEKREWNAVKLQLYIPIVFGEGVAHGLLDRLRGGTQFRPLEMPDSMAINDPWIKVYRPQTLHDYGYCLGLTRDIAKVQDFFANFGL